MEFAVVTAILKTIDRLPNYKEILGFSINRQQLRFAFCDACAFIHMEINRKLLFMQLPKQTKQIAKWRSTACD